jgi:hypothetical protein
MGKHIKNINNKGQFHGYQEWYGDDYCSELWLRGTQKNGFEIGYEEINWDNTIGEEHTEVNFYIR